MILTSELEGLTEEEREGVEAIIYLQAMVDIAEPVERALRNWRNFEQWEKDQTLKCYEIFKKVKKGNA